MKSTRDAFLQRVRQAAADGNRPGTAIPLDQRGSAGYQGAGSDPVERFGVELKAAGGFLHTVPGRDAAVRTILDLVQVHNARQILVGGGAFLASLDLPTALHKAGLEVDCVDGLTSETSRVPFFAAEVGISRVEYLIAETGSVVVASGPDNPRSLSLLPPLHIAVAERRQLLPDLFDLFKLFADKDGGAALPSCLSLITGPSKTGDIELKLVTGVHGPGAIHVVLVDA